MSIAGKLASQNAGPVCSRRLGSYRFCVTPRSALVFSRTGKLYVFSSSCMEQITARYNKSPESSQLHSIENVSEHDSHQPEVDALKMEIAKLQKVYRRMMGKELDGLNFKALQHLEHQLHEGILSKEQVLLEQLEKSRLQEQRALLVENETLREQIEELRRNPTAYHGNCPVEKGNSFASSSMVCHSRSEKERDSDTPLCLGLSAGDAYQRRKIPKIEWGSNESISQMATP